MHVILQVISICIVLVKGQDFPPCPAGSPVPAVCGNFCSSNVECGSNAFCCRGSSCTVICRPRPDPGPKPGTCPRLPPGTVGTCEVACFGDDSCPGTLKCCSNGCGQTCQTPSTNVPGPVPVPKPGTCPRLPTGTVGPCVVECTGDVTCPGRQKCCSNGCGQTCQMPSFNNKPGRCPRFIIDDRNNGRRCFADFVCPGIQKCCRRYCVTPITSRGDNSASCRH